ncbi:MAG: protein kinase [Ilumatobacter sp.]
MTFEIPGFTPIDVIGRGGFGVVHRAADDAHGREVAVKVLPVIDEDSARRRFDRERRAMGTLSGHPNIGVVYTSGFTARNEPYIVMEMIRGGSLGDRLARTGPLPAAEVIDLGLALAEALQVAHEGGVLHLDLKPENILMSRYGRPKIVDFGIAALLDDEARSTTIRATPAYADPAVLDGEAGTARSDVYGLAATLYTLLNGSPPYSDGPSGIYQVMRRVALDPVPLVARADVSDELATALQRAMAKEPSDRPASMNEFAASLQRATPLSWSPSGGTTPTEVPGRPNDTIPHDAGRPQLPAAAPGDASWAAAQPQTAPPISETPASIPGERIAPPQHVIPAQHVTPQNVPPPYVAAQQPTPSGPVAYSPTPQHLTPQELPAPRRRNGSKAAVVMLSLIALVLGAVLAVLLVQRSNPDEENAGASDPTPDTEPIDEIVDDEPLPDAEIVDGLIVVPDLLGDSTQRADLVLENVGLNRTLDPHCFDTVRNTDPAPGLQVEPGTHVLLIYDPCIVPDFVGLSLDDAIDVAENDVVVGMTISWPAHCEDGVIAQSIAAGSEVEPGTAIELEFRTDC